MRFLFASLLVFPLAATAQEQVEFHLAKKTLAALQADSFKNNIEYCGYIGYDFNGKLVASKATVGDQGSCMADDPTEIDLIISSYHTHGGFSHEYFNEMPSGDDMEGDEAEGIDGWVGTPGGRLWFIDTQDMVASQICGIGCLPKDPKFIAGDMGEINVSYHYDELVKRLEED